MAYVINFFGGGYAFFVSVGDVLAGVAIFSPLRRRAWRTPAGYAALAVLGLLLIALSATPLPYLAYVGLGVVSALWLFAERLQATSMEIRLSGSLLASSVSGPQSGSSRSTCEVPYWLPPQCRHPGTPDAST